MAPQSVLALTATAGPPVIDDICDALGISPERVNHDDENALSEQGVNVLRTSRENIDLACMVMDNEESRIQLVSGTLCTLTIFSLMLVSEVGESTVRFS